MTIASHSPQRRPGITMETLWTLAVIAATLALAMGQPVRPLDLWWHLRAGSDILASGALPRLDTLTFTMTGQPYESYAAYWLAEIAMYGGYALGGLELLLLLQGLLMAGAHALLIAVCWRQSGSGRIAAGCALFAALLGMSQWGLRPQALAYPLFALVMYAIDAYRRGGRRAWLLVPPLCVLVWVNSHPTYPLAIVLVGVWLLDELWRALSTRAAPAERAPRARVWAAAATLAVSCAAMLANPRGLGILSHLMSMTDNSVVQVLTTEWRSPTFSDVPGALFLTGLLVAAAVLATTPRRPSLAEMLTFLGFGALGLRTLRGSPWFGLAVAPVLAAALSAWLGAPRIAASHPAASTPPAQAEQVPSRAEGLANVLLACLCVCAVAIRLPWVQPAIPWLAGRAGIVLAETPLAATESLRQAQLPGPLFSDQAFASYLTWAAPEYPVFYYARVGEPTVARDYLWIANAQCGWEKKLADYGVNSLMLSARDNRALIVAVRGSPAWDEVYADAYAVLFVRRERLP